MIFRRASVCIAALALSVFGARAQYASPPSEGQSEFKVSQLIAPSALLAGGLALHSIGHNSVEVPVREYVRQTLRGDAPFYEIGTYARFLPAAAHLTLGLAGVDSRHAFADRAIESALAYAFALGSGYVLKHAFHSPRPDGTDSDSFPSGHSIIAFTGAELLHADYGWAWGGGGYAVAAFTGGERIWGDRHWLGDILAGAGLGILSAHLGRWLLEPFKSLFGIPEMSWDGLSSRNVQVAFTPSADPLSGAPLAGVSLFF